MDLPDSRYRVQSNETFSLGRLDVAELICDVRRQGGKAFRITAYGNSMWPVISSGDIITLSLARDRALRVGDVVAVLDSAEQRFFVHRIVGISDGRFIMKGDNAPCVDGAFERDDILGIVAAVEDDRRDMSRKAAFWSFIYRLYYQVPAFRVAAIPLRPVWRRLRRQSSDRLPSQHGSGRSADS